jgi:hypothetical protein
MGYLDNYFLKKYKNVLKKIVDMFFYYKLMVIKIHAISFLFASPSKIIKMLCTLQRFQFNGI